MAHLVHDAAAVAADLHAAAREVPELAVGRIACPSARRRRVARVGAAELVHEIGDDSVEVQTIVEARLR